MFIEKHDIQIFLIITTITILIVLGFSIALVIMYSKNLRQREKDSFKRVLDEVEKERNRIGQNLHDDVGPFLASARLRMNAAVHKLANDDQVKQTINQQAEFIQQAVTTLRETSHQLAPSNLLKDGLLAGIEERCQEIAALPNWETVIEAKSFPSSISQSSQLNLYRILNELLNNSLKHSNGTSIHIKFREYGKTFEIIYADNGSGLKASPEKINGIGLSGIRTRTELMQGTVSFPKSANGFEAHLNFKITHLT